MKKDTNKFDAWLQNKILIYKGLTPFKGKSIEDILTAIIRSIHVDTEDIKYKLGYLYDNLKDDEEKEFLIERLRAYEEDFSFNSSTDLGDLRQILSYELELRRFQVESATRDSKNYTVIENMKKVSDTLRDLKSKLGISRSQRKTASETSMEYLTRVKKSAVQYMQEHRDEFVWKCSQCGCMHLLGRRHSAYDEFGGIWNLKIIVLYNEGKITLDDAAAILETSKEYLILICKRKNIKLREEDKENGK